MFNDPHAHDAFKEFQAKYRFNTIVETGTHMGEGSLHCSLYRDKVCTIEMNPAFRMAAMRNMLFNGYMLSTMSGDGEPDSFTFVRHEPRRRKEIHTFLGNSPDVIGAILASGRFPRPFLFFLDAHWHDYWPLLDELRMIHRYGMSDSCIVIHDFQVPGKPFGYDSYHGQPLNLDYVREDLFRINPKYKTFYNEKASADSTGRGILFVVPD